MSDVIKSYLAEIERELEAARATEHTYRLALERLIESMGCRISAPMSQSRWSMERRVSRR